MAIDPNSVQKFRAKGVGNMGDVTDETSICRFALPEKFVLAYVKAKFTGGSSSATVTMKSDDRGQDTDYDFVEEQWEKMGTSGTGSKSFLKFRIRGDELHNYVYEAGDELVFEYTNPNTIRWSLEVGLVPASQVSGFNA